MWGDWGRGEGKRGWGGLLIHLSFCCSFARSLVRSFAHSFACLFACLLVRLLVGLFAGLCFNLRKIANCCWHANLWLICFAFCIVASTHTHTRTHACTMCVRISWVRRIVCLCVCASAGVGVWGSRLLHVNPFQLSNATKQERSLKDSRTAMGPNGG